MSAQGTSGETQAEVTALVRMPRKGRGLSARLLALIVLFIMLIEVLLYVPSAARFRENWLERHLDKAHLAALAILAAPDAMVSPELEAELLRGAEAKSISIRRPGSRPLMLAGAMPPDPMRTYDLTAEMAVDMIGTSLRILVAGEDDTIRVIGAIARDPGAMIDVVLDASPLTVELRQYSWRILSLSVVISLFTAGLAFFSLQWLMVRPLRRLTWAMLRFRKAPEDAGRVIVPSGRSDEIGVAEQELAVMQMELRQALTQRRRLAALGEAVAKVNHDLRNILASAQIVSDRIATMDDPAVKQVAPRLINAIDRAIRLCTETLAFGRSEERPPAKRAVNLAAMANDVAASIGPPLGERIIWRNLVDTGLCAHADPDQLFRILLNLGRNAVQALADSGEIRVSAEAAANGGLTIWVSDTGNGLSEQARAHLFQPFKGGSRPGGAGLGLAIARELTESHGGRIHLVNSDSSGTTFRIDLPGPTGN